MARKNHQQCFPLAAILLLFVVKCQAQLEDFSKNFEAFDWRNGPFGFLDNLLGSQEGQTTEGLQDLRQYLNRFGYLDANHMMVNDGDSFDDPLASAIKSFQENYNLEPTGVLDDQTVQQMVKPRCSLPDRVNKTQGAHHRVLGEALRWPSSRFHLTYGVVPSSATKIPVGTIRSLISKVFSKWSSITQFTFNEARDYKNADIKIQFYKRGDPRHEDEDFDGPNGVLAHGYFRPPVDGWAHFDAEENWATVDFPSDQQYDLETLMLHEIGHVLGLQHSSVKGSIMYPTVDVGTKLEEFHDDDIQAIQNLYSDSDSE